MDMNGRKVLIWLLAPVFLLLLACERQEFEETEHPGLEGVWGSTFYSCSAYSFERRDPATGEWLLNRTDPFEMVITPKLDNYTMLKFDGDRVWLMKDSPYIEAPAGEAFECHFEDGRLYTPLLPQIYETDYYEVVDLSDSNFSFVHVCDGKSIATGDSIISGYRGVITLRRLK